MPIEGLVILGSLAAIPLLLLLAGAAYGYRKQGDVLLAGEIVAKFQADWRDAFSRLEPGEVLTNRTWPKATDIDYHHSLTPLLKEAAGAKDTYYNRESWIQKARKNVLAEFPEVRSGIWGYERCWEDGLWPSVIEHEKRAAEEAARKLLVRQPLDRRVEARVLREGGGKCAYCDRHARTLEIDHIIPWSVSHDDSYDNLVVACTRCNRSKGAKSGDALRRWLRRVNCGHPKVMAAAGRAA